MTTPTPKPPVFDVTQFENVDSSSFTVLNQKGDELLVGGKPVVITMHGAGSKVQVSAERKLNKAAKSVLYAGIGGRAVKNAEDDEFQRAAEYLAACTISVENFPVEGGALEIYKNPRLGYITKQAQRHLADEANFMGSSTQS